MKTYEASAKTKEEAIEAGLEALGVGIGDVDVTVLEEGSKGLFGLFGSRMAKVRLTVKETEDDPLKDILADEPAAKPAARKAAEKPAEVKKETRQQKPAEEKPASAKKETVEAEPAADKQEQPRKPAAKQPKGEPGKPVERKKERREKPEHAEKQDVAKEEKTPVAPIHALEKPEVTMIADDQLDPESAAGKASAFLKQLTALMGVPVEISMGTDADGNVYGQMTGDTLGILIGRRGETLDAIQYLTSLKVNKGQENYTRVTLDTENYRAKREDTLVRLANRMANRAVKTGRRVSLEPMNPYERRIIHSALQGNEAVDTHSEGDEPNRHVVITLKK